MKKAVICGTFHRDVAGLRRLIRELETCGVAVLSPLSTEFVSLQPAVVRTATDETLDAATLETMHLRAIREADFIWLHAPNGYVGVSGSFEIGYVVAKKIPIFSFVPLQDVMLHNYVKTVGSVFAALDAHL